MEANNYGNANIAGKLVKVMQECSFVPKNGTNSYHNYKYATAEDVLSAVNQSLARYGIACIVIRRYTTKTGLSDEVTLVTLKIGECKKRRGYADNIYTNPCVTCH